MKKEQWIEEVFQLLCKSQGAENETHRRNLREWAESMGSEEAAYLSEGMTPQEAHDEELSCG